MIHGAVVYSPANPDATTMVIHDNTIVWIGDRVASAAFVHDVDHEIDLAEAFIAPAFVDAHVHLSATGLLKGSVDFVGATSAAECLSRLEVHHRANSTGVLFGHGWDDTHWADANVWNAASVAAVIGQRTAYLTRIDAHSALCSMDLVEDVAATTAGYSSDGVLKQEAHHIARRQVLNQIPHEQLQTAILAALNYAASQGVAAVHECAGPDVSGVRDFTQVAALSNQAEYPQVFAYWGDVDLQSPESLRAFGAAGDLSVDGSLGSRTAWLHQAYADAPTEGAHYLSADQIASHLIACTNKGIQAGFHAIGDAAMSAVVVGLQRAILECGLDAVRSCRHRIEHAELMSDADLDVVRHAGVTLSMQPVFEELWGGSSGMYCTRLGRERTERMNDYGKASALGIPLAFGSDSPVTPIDPWRAVRAATNHRTAESRLSHRAAFSAHTRGGWRATFHDEAGVLAVGAPAHFAAWRVSGFTSSEAVGQGWSTDPRSGTPPLPDLSESLPECLLTVRNGRAIFDASAVWPRA